VTRTYSFTLPAASADAARLAPAVVAILMAAYVVPFAWGNLIPDAIRDLGAALAIARGESFPREGPLINFAFHLGPLSLYLLSVPLFFGPSFTAAALWIGFVGSLKFPLAYATGRALSGPSTGLLLALAAALPSIAGYQALYPFHPVLVEPFAWAALWLAVRGWTQPSVASLYGAALAAGVALQFHPTAAFYAPLPWLALLARRDAHRAWPLHALALALPVAAPFLGWPALRSDIGASPPASLPLATALADVPPLLRGMFWDVPAFFVADTLTPHSADDATLGYAVMAIVYLVALRGALHGFRLAPRARRAAALALAAIVAGTSIVSAMRSTVGYYTLFFLLPPAAVALGIAFLAATARRGTRGGVAPASSPARIPLGRELLIVALAALAVATSAGTVIEARSGILDMHLGGLANPRHVTQGRIRVGRYSMLARDRLGPWLCGELGTPRSIVLHGELAFDLAASFGVDLRMNCPARIADGRLPWLLGASVGDGPGAVEHWLALPDASWRQLGREPTLRFAELGLARPAAVVHPARARALDTQWRYYEVVRDRQPAQTFHYELPAGSATHVLVTRMQPWNTLHEVAVVCAGTARPPVVDTLTTRVFALAGAPCEISLTTDVPDQAGIAVF
jgi:hypothetical protein